MRRFFKVSGFFVLALVVLGALPAYTIFGELRKAASDDPNVYEEDIAALVSNSNGATGGVVFVGSSSIRYWSTLEQDMQPLRVLRHGFGGAKLADIEYYAKRLVGDFDPRAVVVFAGTNDIHPRSSRSPAELLEVYQAFVERVRAGSENVPIYYIGITPTRLRWTVWPVVQQTNALIRNYCESNSGLFYIETGSALLGTDGTPDSKNYRFDGLHLSDAGYAIWTRIIRSRLIADLGEK